MHPRTIISSLAASFVGLAASPGCGNGSSGSSGTPDSSSEASSGSSSSSSGSSGSSGSGGSASSSGSGSSGGFIEASSGPLNDGSVHYCGSTPCDLKSNTCCVSDVLIGMCVPHGQSCPANNAAFNCLGEADCTTAGQVCCGRADSVAETAETLCATPLSGGSPCNNGASDVSAQICESTAECQNGLPCIAQTCNVSSSLPAVHLAMCGLQSAAPFNCTAD
jgi:hypothetical protein